MRQVKFRAYDKKKKKMFEVEELFWTKEGKVLVQYVGEPIDSGRTNEDTELLEFTGLKDKNKKEIFEGDILKSGFKYKEPYLVKIDWAGGCGCCDSNASYGFFFPDDESPQKSEIIGNIYEHGHLLNKEKK